MIDTIESYILDNYTSPDFPQKYEEFIKKNYKTIEPELILGDEHLTQVTNEIIEGKDVDVSHLFDGTFKDYDGVNVFEPETDFLNSLALQARYIDDSEYLQWLNDDKMAKVLAEFPTRGDLIDHLGPTIEELSEKIANDPNLELLINNMTYKSHPLAFYEFSQSEDFSADDGDFGFRDWVRKGINYVKSLFTKNKNDNLLSNSKSDYSLDASNPIDIGNINSTNKLADIAMYGSADEREAAKDALTQKYNMLTNRLNNRAAYGNTSLPVAGVLGTATGYIPNQVSKGILNITSHYSPGVLTHYSVVKTGPTHHPDAWLQGQVRNAWDMSNSGTQADKVISNMKNSGKVLERVPKKNGGDGFSMKDGIPTGPATPNSKVNAGIQARRPNEFSDGNDRRDPRIIDSYNEILADQLDSVRNAYSKEINKTAKFTDQLNNIQRMIETGNVGEYIDTARRLGVLNKLEEIEKYEKTHPIKNDMATSGNPWNFEDGDWISDRKLRRQYNKEDKRRFTEAYTQALGDTLDRKYGMGEYAPKEPINKLNVLVGGAATVLAGKLAYDYFKGRKGKPSTPVSQVQKSSTPQTNVIESPNSVTNLVADKQGNKYYISGTTVSKDHSISLNKSRNFNEYLAKMASEQLAMDFNLFSKIGESIKAHKENRAISKDIKATAKEQGMKNPGKVARDTVKNLSPEVKENYTKFKNLNDQMHSITDQFKDKNPGSSNPGGPSNENPKPQNEKEQIPQSEPEIKPPVESQESPSPEVKEQPAPAAEPEVKNDPVVEESKNGQDDKVVPPPSEERPTPPPAEELSAKVTPDSEPEVEPAAEKDAPKVTPPQEKQSAPGTEEQSNIPGNEDAGKDKKDPTQIAGQEQSGTQSTGGTNPNGGNSGAGQGGDNLNDNQSGGSGKNNPKTQPKKPMSRKDYREKYGVNRAQARELQAKAKEKLEQENYNKALKGEKLGKYDKANKGKGNPNPNSPSSPSTGADKLGNLISKASDAISNSKVYKDYKSAKRWEAVGNAAKGVARGLGKVGGAVLNTVGAMATNGNAYGGYRPPVNGYPGRPYGYGYYSENETKSKDGARWE